jgi:hypothetical protein
LFASALFGTQLEVFPEEELRVLSTDEVPNDDYGSVFDADLPRGASLAHCCLPGWARASLPTTHMRR